MANAKRRRRKGPNFTERVHEALAGSPLHTVMLNIEQTVDKLSLSQVGLETSMKFVVDDQQEAKQSRRGIHEKLNDLGAGQARTEERLTAVERDVKGLRSDVNRHEAVYQQGLGRKGLIEQAKRVITPMRAAVTAIASGGGLAAYLHWPWFGK